jgi:hypothetical protein
LCDSARQGVLPVVEPSNLSHTFCRVTNLPLVVVVDAAD